MGKLNDGIQMRPTTMRIPDPLWNCLPNSGSHGLLAVLDGLWRVERTARDAMGNKIITTEAY
jgi:hypothetical protein